MFLLLCWRRYIIWSWIYYRFSRCFSCRLYTWTLCQTRVWDSAERRDTRGSRGIARTASHLWSCASYSRTVRIWWRKAFYGCTWDRARACAGHCHQHHHSRLWTLWDRLWARPGCRTYRPFALTEIECHLFQSRIESWHS